MVRNYVVVGKHSQYDENSLKNALLEVKSGRMTVFKAAKTFNVPYSTVYTNYKGVRGKIKKGKGRSTALPVDLETSLATGVKTLERWGFGLSRNEILDLVAQFVKSNDLATPFKNSRPGEDWFLGFKKRYNLSIKKPQSLEYSRRKATDPFTIFEYFDLLESTLNSLGIKDKPRNIWNLDESSLCIDPTKTKVVGERGKSASRVTSGPGRENTTILLLANAAGEKAPPLIIFKGRHMWDQWCAPEGTGYPGTVYASSKKGWMETDIFKNYFKRTLIPSLGENRPVLVIYDGHSTHISVDLIQLAIREDITLLKLPPHSSHLLQPLDLCVFKSFKDKWDAQLVTWQRNNIGRKLPKSLFSKFLGDTWKQITPEVIENGFIRGGIHPFNRTVVPDEKFCPEALRRWRREQINKHSTSRQVEEIESPAPNHQIPQPSESFKDINNKPSTSTERSLTSKEQPSSLKEQPSASKEQPSISKDQPLSYETHNPHPLASGSQSPKTFETLLLEMVRQSPRPEKTKRQRVTIGSEVLTNADVLERLMKNKKETEQKKAAKSKRHKKQDSSSEEEENEIEYRDSDNEQEYLDSLEHEMEMQHQENHMNLDLDEDKWVLVKYTSKKAIQHFVGQVTKSIEEDWEVRFLKRVATKRRDIFKFEWPSVQDIDTVTETSIIKILPNPQTDRRGLFYFNILFDGYNL